MAKQATAAKQNPTLIARITAFIQEVKSEMTKVAWPSTEELKSSTTVVLLLVIAVAIVILAFDTVASNVIVRLLQASR